MLYMTFLILFILYLVVYTLNPLSYLAHPFSQLFAVIYVLDMIIMLPCFLVLTSKMTLYQMF